MAGLVVGGVASGYPMPSLKWRGFVSLVQRLPLLAPLPSAGPMLG